MYDYDAYQISNLLTSFVNPGSVKLHSNYTSAYFRKYLFEKAISVFKWTLPEQWDRDYFLYVLFGMGYVGVIPTSEFGAIPQMGTISGYNLYYAPRILIVSNPLLTTKEYEIHKDCELIKLQGNYSGILDLVAYYSSKMALISEAIDMNLQNSKSSKIFFAKDKSAAQTMKKIYDQISEGNPAVVTDKELLDENGKPTWLWFSENLGQNYITDDLLVDLRKVENQFCTEVGIPNTNTDKRERMTDDEVNANNVETYTRAELWLDRLQACCEKVNNKYDLNLSVEWRHDPNDSNNVSLGDDAAGRDDPRRDRGPGRRGSAAPAR